MAVDLTYEKDLGGCVIGIDEAGRGPLAGGVYAAAVTVPLPLAEELLVGAWRGINDSKKLSPKKREQLAAVIKATEGCTWAVASASAAEIDELNILRATHLAMKRAADMVLASLPHTLQPQPLLSNFKSQISNFKLTNRQIDESANRQISDSQPTPTPTPTPAPTPPSAFSILVDGLPVKTLPNSHNLVKGDAKSLFIAAASILAKTARDADCARLEAAYPGYGFLKHKGYPTAAHYAALARLGPSPEHRRSFRLTAES